MIADLIKENVTLVSAGVLALAGAANGSHVAFSAWFDADTVAPYVITDGDNREVGFGTYRTATNTFENPTPTHTIVGGVHTKSGAVAIDISSGTATIAVDLTAGFMSTKSDDGHAHVAADIADLAALFDAKLDLTGGVISGDLTVQNLTVQGDFTTVTANEVNIGDATLTLNALLTGAPTIDAGLIINRGTGAYASMMFDETADIWKATHGLEIDGSIAALGLGVAGLSNFTDNLVSAGEFFSTATGQNASFTAQRDGGAAVLMRSQGASAQLLTTNNYALGLGSNGTVRMNIETGGDIDILAGALQFGGATAIDASRNIFGAAGSFSGALAAAGLTVNKSGVNSTFDSGALAAAQLDFKRNGVLEGFLSWDLGNVTLSANGGTLNFADAAIFGGAVTVSRPGLTDPSFVVADGLGTTQIRGRRLEFDGAGFITTTSAAGLDLRINNVNALQLGTDLSATFAGLITGNDGALLTGSATADARYTFTQTTAGLTGTIQQGSTGFAISALGAQALLLNTNGVLALTLDSNQNATFGTGSGASIQSATSVTLDGSSHHYLTFANTATTEGGILWADPQDNDAAYFVYDHNSQTLRMGAGATQVLTASSTLFDVKTAMAVGGIANLSNIVIGPSLISRDVNSDAVFISGGNGSSNGANIYMLGGTHPTQANDMHLRAGGTPWLSWDNSAGSATFAGAVDLSGNVLTGVGNLFMDGEILNSSPAGELFISGSNSINTGGNIVLRGGTHPTQANDTLFRAGTATTLHYDDSASTWDFQGNDIVGVGSATFSGGVAVGGILESTAALRTVISGVTTVFASDVSGAFYEIQGDNDWRMLLNGVQRFSIDAGTGEATFVGDVTQSKVAPLNILADTDTSLGADQVIGGHLFSKVDPSGGGAGIVGGMRMLAEGGVGESTYLAFYTSGASLNDVEFMRGNSDLSTTFAGDAAIANIALSSDGQITSQVAGSTSSVKISGGFTPTAGATLQLFASNHTTNGDDFLFSSGGINRLFFDSSQSRFDFLGNSLDNVGEATFAGDVISLQTGNSLVQSETSTVAAYSILRMKTPSYNYEWNVNDSTGEIQLYSQTASALLLAFDSSQNATFAGAINAASLPTFADDTAAAALVTGDLYRTTTGEVRFKL